MKSMKKVMDLFENRFFRQTINSTTTWRNLRDVALPQKSTPYVTKALDSVSIYDCSHHFCVVTCPDNVPWQFSDKFWLRGLQWNFAKYQKEPFEPVVHTNIKKLYNQTKNDSAAWQVGLYYRRKAGGPARLQSGGRGPTGIGARSTSHSLRYAALRSDWVRWLMEAR